MKRRQALQSLAGISVASALPLPSLAQQPAPAAVNESPTLDAAPAEAAASGLHSFFSADQFATLERLSNILMPAHEDLPGATDAGVAEFLDFLLSASPPARQSLYRDGLDHLSAQARTRYGRPFPEITAAEADTLLAPLREP